MGFNTCVVILNDQIDAIKRHPEQFVDELIGAIGLHGYKEPYIRGQTQVVSVAHADNYQVVLVGRNTGTVLGSVHGGADYSAPDELSVLRQLADKLGYALRKKPTKNKHVHDFIWNPERRRHVCSCKLTRAEVWPVEDD